MVPRDLTEDAARLVAGARRPASTASVLRPAPHMILESAAFAHGEAIPRRYACDGEDVSPPLSWKSAPDHTRTFALVMDDPDAPKGTWIHWVLFNLPADVSALPEGTSGSHTLPDAATEGANGWGRAGYGGPCPPSGTHRYFFKLYALDRELDLPRSATSADLSRAIVGHVLAEATLMGRYRKSGAS